MVSDLLDHFSCLCMGNREIGKKFFPFTAILLICVSKPQQIACILFKTVRANIGIQVCLFHKKCQLPFYRFDCHTVVVFLCSLCSVKVSLMFVFYVMWNKDKTWSWVDSMGGCDNLFCYFYFCKHFYSFCCNFVNVFTLQ